MRLSTPKEQVASRRLAMNLSGSITAILTQLWRVHFYAAKGVSSTAVMAVEERELSGTEDREQGDKAASCPFLRSRLDRRPDE